MLTRHPRPSLGDRAVADIRRLPSGDRAASCSARVQPGHMSEGARLLKAVIERNAGRRRHRAADPMPLRERNTTDHQSGSTGRIAATRRISLRHHHPPGDPPRHLSLHQRADGALSGHSWTLQRPLASRSPGPKTCTTHRQNRTVERTNATRHQRSQLFGRLRRQIPTVPANWHIIRLETSSRSTLTILTEQILYDR